MYLPAEAARPPWADSRALLRSRPHRTRTRRPRPPARPHALTTHSLTQFTSYFHSESLTSSRAVCERGLTPGQFTTLYLP